MEFTLDVWKSQAAERLRRIGSWLERGKKQDAPYLLYGALCGLSLWPLVEVAQSGQLLPAMMALGSVAGGVGGNLLANQLQAWKDQADEVTEVDLATWVAEHTPDNPNLRQALDTILEEMEAIPQAQAALNRTERQWFIETLRAELAELGNLTSFRTTLTGSGALAWGPKSRAAGERAVVADTVGESIITTGDNNSITYILNQYLGPDEQEPKRATLRRQIDSYLTWLQDRCGTIELRGIKREGQQVVQLDLNEVYVPLEAHSHKEARSIRMDEVLGLGRRIVITGGPGSGKTTVLMHIAWTLATAIVNNKPVLAQEKLGLKDTCLDDLKAILENASQMVQSEGWFRDYSILEGLRLDKAHEIAAQLAQVWPGDTLMVHIEAAQERLNRLKPIVRNANEIERAARLTEEFEKVDQKVRELRVNLEEDDEVLQALIREARRLTFEFQSAWAKTPQFRSDPESLDGQDLEERIAQVKPKDIRASWEQAEEQVSANSGEARRIKEAIEKAQELVLAITDALPLPVFVPLSAYGTHLRQLPATSDPRDTTLVAFISYYLIKKQSSFGLPADFFEQVLRDGRAVILLLDGLDEVPSEPERVQVREAIEELVTGRPTIWAVVTCRNVAYKERTALGKDFQEVRVLPLNSHHVNKLVNQAYAHLYRHDPGQQAERTNELLDGIRRIEERWQQLGEKVGRLVSSPLLVRMLLVVHFSERHLPEQRAELYMRATDAMLLPEHAPDQAIADFIGRQVGGSKEIHRDIVQYLAFTMHSWGESEGLEISEDALRRVLEKEPAYSHLTNDLIALTRARGTLLEERLGVYRFIHLAFQEFLAARYLAEITRDEQRIANFFLEKKRILVSWWREPALLVVGYLSVTSPQTGYRVLRCLAGLESAAAWQMSGTDQQLATLEIAITAYLEWPAADKKLGEDLARQLSKLLTESDWPPIHRVHAGDLLARLGDTRPGVILHSSGLPDIEWCQVPARPFIMGSHKNQRLLTDGDEASPQPIVYQARDGTTLERYFQPDDDETPQTIDKSLIAYQISRHPITNAQYAAFVQDGGYLEKNWWTEAGWAWKGNRTEPETFGGPFKFANHPVVGVNWYEAVAFCRWLTTRLQESNEIGSNEVVTLPSERQWERAARGTDGRHYPWGNQVDPNRANYMDTGIGHTSPVGGFLGGRSPCGCEEMSGNVWEWCLTKWREGYQAYRDDNDIEGDEIRVLRGGSFESYWLSTRCAVRGYADPYVRNKDTGFRVVLSSI